MTVVKLIRFFLFTSVSMMFIQSCDNKGMYINLQKHQEFKCNRVPESDYDECMKEAKKSYEDYKEKREEIINK